MGSGPGDAGSSHASVHRVRSWRAGFPVMERERTVSRAVACSTFCMATGWRSLSVVAGQTEAIHAPSAPSASAGAMCRAADPARGGDGPGRDRVHHAGEADAGADLAGGAG